MLTSLITLYLSIHLASSASSGAKKCDALGLCVIPESGAYINDAGNATCPWGMHLVSPPQRNNAYIVSTAPVGEDATLYYTPGEVMDIHVTVVGEPHMKFLGILMYAVSNDGVLGVEGCPGGCDGKDEVKIGTWEQTNDLFQVSSPCNNQAVTHTNADVKPYHNVFRWRAPEEPGYGDVIFRVVIKQGSTNMGHFWWPMEEDLMLMEGPISTASEWFAGSPDESCTAICAQRGLSCDRSMPTGTLGHYEHIGKKLSCQLPLLSSCSRGSITRDIDGYCWLDNQESGLCDSDTQHVNVCDAVEFSSGSERLCPCVSNVDGWVPQTTQAPSTAPSTTPSVSPSTVPSTSPTNWFTPRWIEVFVGESTTCANGHRIERPCKKHCSLDFCQQKCDENDNCHYFWRSDNGRCELFNGCTNTRSANGITIQKFVATTQEPTTVPTVSSPTSDPSTSPSASPTTPQPSTQPSVMPSKEPSVAPTSAPSMAPSNWYTPRWVEVLSSSSTCAQTHRIARPCMRHCSRDFCQTQCEENANCAFYHRAQNGRCELFDECTNTRDANGVTVQKFVATTLEPTTVPTVSSPTSDPSSSPSASPTTPQPSSQPSVMPSKEPSVAPTSAPSMAPSNWYTPRWVEVLSSSSTCAQTHRIARPCKKHCSRDFCQAQCEENASCAFFYRSQNGRCELFEDCTNTREANGVTVQKYIPTTLEPSLGPSVAPTPRARRVLSTIFSQMHEVLLFRQTVPFRWTPGVLSLNSDDPQSENFSILDQLEGFRFDGSFHFKLRWPQDDDAVEYEWLQTSNPLTESIEGYVPISIPYTGRSWGGLEPSQKALMDGSVNHSNWFYAVGSYRLWKGGYPSYAKTRKDNRYPQPEVELYVVAPVNAQ